MRLAPIVHVLCNTDPACRGSGKERLRSSRRNSLNKVSYTSASSSPEQGPSLMEERTAPIFLPASCARLPITSPGCSHAAGIV